MNNDCNPPDCKKKTTKMRAMEQNFTNNDDQQIGKKWKE